MNHQIRGVLLFVAYALLGPTVALFTVRLGPPMNLLVYELVTFLWPFWPVAQYEAVMGTVRAVGLAILLNVCAFAALGLVAGMLASSKAALLGLYICASIALFSFAWFVSDNLAEISYASLFAALALLCVPFVVLARVAIDQIQPR